jgi:hypothetical protein
LNTKNGSDPWRGRTDDADKLARAVTSAVVQSGKVTDAPTMQCPESIESLKISPNAKYGSDSWRSSTHDVDNLARAVFPT